MSGMSVSTAFTAQDKITSAFRKMGRGAGIFENKATRSFRNVGRAGSRTGSIIKGILGAQFITKGISLLVGGLREATTQFIGFDQAVTSASSKFKGLNLATAEGQKTLEALKNTAREVGATTQFTAGQAAEGLDFLAMAGFNADQAMAALKPTVDLATVGQIDLSRATDIASDSLGAFGLMTDDTNKLQENFTRLNDVMALTMSRTNTNMEDMFEAIKKGAPTFTAAGQSMESFNALLGTMANSGVKGSEAGTALRNVMLRLSNPVGEAQSVLDNLGITTQDAGGNFRDVIDILSDFEVGLKGMGSAQRTAALSTVFGARAVTGVNILLAEGTDQLKAFRGELEASAGASQDMASVIRSSLQNRLASLKSAAIEVGFKFLQAFQGRAGNAIEFITEKIRDFNVQPIIDGVNFISNIFKTLLPIVKPVIEKIITIAKELFTIFKESEAGAILIDLTTTAFKTLGVVISTTWKIIKPILKTFLKILEPILKVMIAIIDGIGKVSDFIGGGSGVGASQADLQAAGQARITGGEPRETRQAPNQAAVQRVESRFQGRLDISTAPGINATVQGRSGSSRDFDLRLLGQN